MGNLALLGRLLFAFLFLSSGAQKLASFNLEKGGPTMEFMAPKLDEFFAGVRSLTGVHFDVPQEIYVYLLGIAIFLELAGGILFVLGSKLGATLLALFLLAVTPIMHNFWTMPENSQEQLTDMIMFFKNLALLGATFFFIGASPTKLKRA